MTEKNLLCKQWGSWVTKLTSFISDQLELNKDILVLKDTEYILRAFFEYLVFFCDNDSGDVFKNKTIEFFDALESERNKYTLQVFKKWTTYFYDKEFPKNKQGEKDDSEEG